MAVKINGKTVLDNTVNNRLSVGKNGSNPYINGYNSVMVGTNLLNNRSARFLQNTEASNIIIGYDISSNNSFATNVIYTNVTGTTETGTYKSTASSDSYVRYGMYQGVTAGQGVVIKFKVNSLGNLKVGLWSGTGSQSYEQASSMSVGISMSGGFISFKDSFGSSGFSGGGLAYSVGSVIELHIGVGVLSIFVDGVLATGINGSAITTFPSGGYAYPIFTFGTTGMEVQDVVVLNSIPTASQINSSAFTKNIFIGSGIAGKAITSDSSIAIGDFTLSNAVSTTNNVVIGYRAAESSTTAEQITAIGKSTLSTNTTGIYLAALGTLAGSLNTVGSYNTYIGAESGGYPTTFGIITGTNISCIGYRALPSDYNVNNEITLGNSSISSLRCAVTSITSLSDARDKKDVTPLIYGIDFVNSLNPVAFTWDSRDKSKVGIKSSGFLAQDLQETQNKFNAAEVLNLVYETNPDKLEATYGNLVPVLVKAIQELSQKVTSLEKQLANT